MTLKILFGQRYRIAYDPAHTGHADDPQLQIIPCRHGHIYVHGQGMLGFASYNRGPIAKRVADLPDTAVVQDGDDGLNITFGLALFELVAKIVKPNKRRVLSKAQQQAAIDRLKPHQFRPSTAVLRPKNERQSLRSDEVDH